mmetsp:Transcript_10280/g.20167  ORF Transcript_10280/g.20167 Transcript_10280/m.20167 type:complete len:346 (+) Transcript_10280:577-1614(+)
MGRLSSTVTTLYFLWAVVMAFISAFILQILCWVLFAWMMPKYKRMRLMGRIFRTACLFFCIHLNPFWSVTIRRRHQWKGKLPRRAIYMSNHLSFADPFILCKVFMPRTAVNFIAKAAVFNYPLAGWSIRMAGDLPVHFTKSADGRGGVKHGTVALMMETVSRYLENGIGICVFPEGTLSPTGELKPFKHGFFDAAIKNDVPIMPLAMWGNLHAWPARKWFARPANIEIGIGQAIYPMEGETATELNARVREAILDLRDNLPLFKKTASQLSEAPTKTAIVAPGADGNDLESGEILATHAHSPPSTARKDKQANAMDQGERVKSSLKTAPSSGQQGEGDSDDIPSL